MKINPREKLMLVAGGVVLFFILYFFLAVDTALSQRRKWRRGIEEQKASLAEMREYKKKWEELELSRQGAKGRLSHRPQDFTLLSFLEQVSNEANIQDKRRFIKPLPQAEENKSEAQIEGVETELEGVNIRELVDFLYRIEYSENLVSVKRIKIQRSNKTQLLKVTLQIITYTTT